MKKIILPIVALLTWMGVNAQNDLMITGVYDGPLTGGIPKGIELYVINPIADLSDYGIGSATNGPTDGEEFTFPAVSATAGQFIYVSSETTGFNTFFGFMPDYTDASMGINGDDPVELFFMGAVSDVYGAVGTDGTGEPWEYVDSWSYRNDCQSPSATFNIANWTVQGPGGLTGAASNGSATNPIPAGTYNCGGPVINKVTFQAGVVNFDETAGSNMIVVNMSEVAVAGDSVVIGIMNGTGTVYGSDYTTTPNGSTSEFTIGFAADSTWSSFDLSIIDDSDWEQDEEIKFYFKSFIGSVDTSGTVDTLVATIDVNDIPLGAGDPVFINEIHYDNDNGTTGDTLEGFEIAGPAGTDIGTFRIILYNGSGGAAYDEIPLSGIIPDLECGFGTINFDLPNNGMQNGPDGIVLYDTVNATVVQFLSYESVITATDGVASGMSSEDIGVEEAFNSLVFHSLQLGGTGYTYTDFAWQGSSAETRDLVNNNQSFCVTPAGPEISFDYDSSSAVEGSPLPIDISIVNKGATLDTFWVVFDRPINVDATDAGLPGSDTVMFAAGLTDSVWSVPMSTFTDGIVEGDEFFTLRIFATSANLGIGFQDVLNLKIIDADYYNEANFDVNSVDVAENVGTYTVTMSVVDSALLGDSIIIDIIEGAGIVHGAGNDYTLANGDSVTTTIVVPIDSMWTSFDVVINDDVIMEGNETITFVISGWTGTLDTVALDTFKLTILDDDVPPAIQVNSGSTTLTINETDGTATIDFDIFPAPAAAGTMQLLVTNGSGATYGSDYTTTPAVATNMITVTVPMNATSFSFDFDIINDVDVEANETVTFTVVGFSAGLDTVTGSLTSTVTMVSEDVPVASGTKIYDIQFSTAGGTFDSPLVGDTVTTYGVVTAIKTGANAGYWIQDSAAVWNGIFVLDGTNTPSRGDSIEIRGLVDEYFGLTEVKNVVNYTVLKTGATLPTPVVVTTSNIQTAEANEGVLIMASMANCDDDNVGFGQWTINNGGPTDSALVDDELFSFTPVVNNDYDVTGIGQYSFSEYKILPRDVNDIVGPGIFPTVKKIYDIQFSTASDFASPEDGNQVITVGVVTGIIQFGADSGRFFIQDSAAAWNGIYVYENGYVVNVGDSVEVHGTVDEFFGLTEIVSVTDVTILSSSNALPTAVDVTTAEASTKAFEGVRSRAVGANCSAEMDQFVNWEVTRSNVALEVSSVIWEYIAPVLGNQYNVTGIMHFGFGEFRLLSTDVADTMGVGIADAIAANSIQLYPNPAKNMINVAFTSNGANPVTLIVKDVLGRTLYTENVTAFGNVNRSIDLSRFENGMYTVQFVANGNQISRKFTVVH